MDVDHPGPNIVFELGQAFVLRVDEVDVRGAVVEDVDAPEALDRVADQGLDERGRGDVDMHRRRAVAARRRGHGLRAFEGDVRDDDLRSFGGHRRCAGTPHPRAAADDERDLPGEPARHQRSSRASGAGRHGRYCPSAS